MLKHVVINRKSASNIRLRPHITAKTRDTKTERSSECMSQVVHDSLVKTVKENNICEI